MLVLLQLGEWSVCGSFGSFSVCMISLLSLTLLHMLCRPTHNLSGFILPQKPTSHNFFTSLRTLVSSFVPAWPCSGEIVCSQCTGNSGSVQQGNWELLECPRGNWEFLECLEKELGILWPPWKGALLGASEKSSGHAGAKYSGLQQCLVLLWLLEWANGGL